MRLDKIERHKRETYSMRRIFIWRLFILHNIRLHFWDRGGIVVVAWFLFIDGGMDGKEG